MLAQSGRSGPRHRASTQSRPRNTLAGGRLRAGGLRERDRGGGWGGWAVGGGDRASGCGDAAASSISKRGCSVRVIGAARERLVAPGQNSPLMRLQLGDLAFPVDGWVGAVLLAGHDEDPSTRSPNFPCQAPTRRQRGVKRGGVAGEARIGAGGAPRTARPHRGRWVGSLAGGRRRRRRSRPMPS